MGLYYKVVFFVVMILLIQQVKYQSSCIKQLNIWMPANFYIYAYKIGKFEKDLTIVLIKYLYKWELHTNCESLQGATLKRLCKKYLQD